MSAQGWGTRGLRSPSRHVCPKMLFHHPPTRHLGNPLHPPSLPLRGQCPQGRPIWSGLAPDKHTAGPAWRCLLSIYWGKATRRVPVLGSLGNREDPWSWFNPGLRHGWWSALVGGRWAGGRNSSSSSIGVEDAE